MEKNVGKNDKIFRVVVVLLIAFAAYSYNIWWLYIIAFLPLITVFTGHCPPYKWFGINTAKKPAKD